MRRKKYRITKVLKILFACCFAITAAGALRLYYLEYREAGKLAELARIHDGDNSAEAGESEAGGELPEGPSEEFLRLAGLNEDYLGWLTVYGTQTDLPVVLGEDNEYYLHHDFYREESSYGTLFADCLTDRVEDGNLLIYGHHMRNGSMFGKLTSFCDREFFQEHSLVRWEAEDGVSYYEIFAVMVVPGYEEAGDYLPVRDYLGEPEPEQQKEILETLKDRASLWRELSFSENDRILFLMTCDYTRYNGRLLVCAKKFGSGGIDR